MNLADQMLKMSNFKSKDAKESALELIKVNVLKWIKQAAEKGEYFQFIRTDKRHFYDEENVKVFKEFIISKGFKIGEGFELAGEEKVSEYIYIFWGDKPGNLELSEAFKKELKAFEIYENTSSIARGSLNVASG